MLFRYFWCMSRCLIFLLFSVIIFSCKEDEIPISNEEVIVENPPKQKHICDFDISDKEGNFELYRKWEFVGFQDIQTGEFDQNTTCSARIAHFALNGEDFDNLLKISLEFEKEISESGNCADLRSFEARTIARIIEGCYEDDADGISMVIDSKGITEIPSNVANTLPVHHFENTFLEYLSAVKVYQIESNKLYLYGKEGRYRMTFLALE
ncbi:hypothetical protein C943_00848 [Mariniradius saccharolyticus AK6]|uniref:Uncharacterized protein n=2 Tax=Mariniradius TaxID=1245590 RepID=M7XWI6_9BACT|nr:hypothetical protein C943_00848 [Mariniradius saccharolyticus AK6]